MLPADSNIQRREGETIIGSDDYWIKDFIWWHSLSLRKLAQLNIIHFVYSVCSAYVSLSQLAFIQLQLNQKYSKHFRLVNSCWQGRPTRYEWIGGTKCKHLYSCWVFRLQMCWKMLGEQNNLSQTWAWMRFTRCVVKLQNSWALFPEIPIPKD